MRHNNWFISALGLNKKTTVLVLSAVLSFSSISCFSTSSSQHLSLETLQRENPELTRFEFSVGKSGSVVFLDVQKVESTANPMTAVKAFLVLASQARTDSYESFELRHQSKTRYRFSKAQADDFAEMHETGASQIALLQKIVTQAQSHLDSNAERALATQPSPGPASFRALTQEAQNFLQTWFWKTPL